MDCSNLKSQINLKDDQCEMRVNEQLTLKSDHEFIDGNTNITYETCLPPGNNELMSNTSLLNFSHKQTKAKTMDQKLYVTNVCGQCVVLDDNETDNCSHHVMSLTDLKKDYLHRLDNSYATLQNWEGTLRMKMKQIYLGQFVQVNILDFTSYNTNLVPVYYFDTEIYPITDDFKGDGWIKLKTDILTNAFNSGFKLFSAGGPSKKLLSTLKDFRQFRCSINSRKYIDRSNKSTTNTNRCRNDYCQPKRNGDHNKKGRKPNNDGKKMSRMSSSLMSMNGECTCKFSFYISFDHNGFYVMNGKGNKNHVGHPKLKKDNLKFPTRLIDKTDEAICKQMAQSGCSNGVIRNFIHKKTGKLFTLHNVRYLAKLTTNIQQIEELKNLNSTEKIIHHFKTKKYDYISLYAKTLKESNNVSIVTDNNVGTMNDYTSKNLVLNEKEKKEAKKFSEINRISLNLTSEQHLLIGVAWVTPFESDYYHMFPEVIMVDTVADTNNEGRPLLTIAGMTTSYKVFYILRAFLPNQCSWVFRWIFSFAMPTIFGNLLKKTKIIVSDGDPHLCAQIDNAISNFFKSAIRVRCGWHIVDRGFKAHGPKKSDVEPPNDLIYDQVCRNIYNWVYSFMDNRCETKEEYLKSKFLLVKYVESDYVVNNLTERFSKKVLNWLEGYVFTHEDNYCFYLRSHIRHYMVRDNCRHEGSNNAIKHSSAAVTPSHTLLRSSVLLSLESERRNQKMDMIFTKELIENNTWDNLEFGNFGLHVCKKCTYLVKDEIKKSKSYINSRVSQSVWLVTWKNNQDENRFLENGSYTIPIFKRKRMVSYGSGIFTCSCPCYNVDGFPCRHIINVVSSIDGYIGLSHHDISVKYWNMYHYFSKHESDNKDVSHILQFLRKNDANGVYCPQNLIDKIQIVDTNELPNEFAFTSPKCVNHSKIDELPLSNFAAAGMEVSLSQSLLENNSESDESCCVLEISEFNENFSSLGENEKTSLKIDSSRKTNAYKDLSSYFKSLCEKIDKFGNEDDICRVRDFMMYEDSLLNTKLIKKNPQSKHIGTMISSNTAFSKKRKTHGNKY